MASFKTVIVALSLAAVLALPVATMAAATTKPAKTPKTKAPKNAAGDTSTSSTATPTPIELSGTIIKTDGGDVVISFKVPTNFATKVTVDGDTKALADLKVGESVKLTFSGTSTATTVEAKTPATQP